MSRLHLILKPFMLRRIKKDVENELTDKVEVLLYCPLTIRQRLLYSALKSNIRLEELLAGLGLWDGGGNGNGSVSNLMNLVMQFRKVCNHPELFERREAKSPLLLTVPPLVLPKLVLLDRPARPAHHPRHSVYRADRVHQSLCRNNGKVATRDYLEVSDSAFSFLRFCDIVPGEVENLAVNLYHRWLHLARTTAHTLLQKYSPNTSTPLILPQTRLPEQLVFISTTSRFLAHRDHNISSTPETVAHRLLRSRSAPTHLIHSSENSPITSSLSSLPEFPHLPRPPETRTCIPTPCPPFLHYLTPRASSLPTLPYSPSRSVQYLAQVI